MRNSLRITTIILSMLLFTFAFCSCTTTVVYQCECPHVEASDESVTPAVEEALEPSSETVVDVVPEPEADVMVIAPSSVEIEDAVIEEVSSAEEPIPEEIVEESPWAIGDIGPNGGLVFNCNSLWLEITEPEYEVESYEAALEHCRMLSEETCLSYRLPSIDELLAIYEQLVESELAEVDWTYYWSCEVVDEVSVKVMNFDTGFEGSFYRTLGIISVIPVTEI